MPTVYMCDMPPPQATPDDIRLIEHESRITAIVIEGEQSQTALKPAFERSEESEAALRAVQFRGFDVRPLLRCGH